MTNQNRQWILARRPVGEIKDGDLVFRNDPIPTPGRGEVVVVDERLGVTMTEIVKADRA